MLNQGEHIVLIEQQQQDVHDESANSQIDLHFVRTPQSLSPDLIPSQKGPGFRLNWSLVDFLHAVDFGPAAAGDYFTCVSFPENETCLDRSLYIFIFFSNWEDLMAHLLQQNSISRR